MKKRLIAIVLSATVFGGVSVAAYAASGQANECEINNANESCKNLKAEGIVPHILNGRSLDLLRNMNSFVGNESCCTDKNISTCENNKGIPVGKDVSNKNQKIDNSKDVNSKDFNKVLNKSSKNKKSSGSNITNNVSKKESINKNNTASKTEDKTSDSGKNTISKNTSSNEINSNNFMAQVESLIFKKVNEERQKAGMPTLKYSNTMEKYGRIKSKDMGDNGYFDHRDLSGNLITEKMKADGVRYSAWGENIAYISGVNDANALANQFMTNWMNSQGHRENILSTKYSEIGVGVYKIGNRVYATQEFYR